MKEIGGYFELEFPKLVDIDISFPGIYVNSGRHAFEYLLCALRESKRNVRHVYIPIYTCDVMLQPLERMNIPYTFYNIDRTLTIPALPQLKDGEYIVINNYFGIQDAYVKELAHHYGEQAIIDNAQAWYAPSIEGVMSIYSPRKFFGLPDGGRAVNAPKYSVKLDRDKSSGRCSHLLKRVESEASCGYADFRANSAKINETPLLQMSVITHSMIESIDMEQAKRKRLANFEYLHKYLAPYNQLPIALIDDFACPMVYPYMIGNGRDLRRRLIENKIYVATYWPNVYQWSRPGSDEHYLADNLLPLPIDQRYNSEDMQSIIDIIER